ncbi:hypothetical protein TNCV_2601921 [Trichonephila clavipes]|nr:hypothetical protein TNCV_2601921 [Trichonephila clavipes]
MEALCGQSFVPINLGRVDEKMIPTARGVSQVACPMSFYSIKNLIKRSIKARSQEDLYNRVSHKSWRNAILNLRNGPRRRVVTEFRPASGHDCLLNHQYRFKVFPFRYALCATLQIS